MLDVWLSILFPVVFFRGFPGSIRTNQLKWPCQKATVAGILHAQWREGVDGCKNGGWISAPLPPWRPDSERYYTVAGRCNSSHRLLDLGEKGVYPSYTPTSLRTAKRCGDLIEISTTKNRLPQELCSLAKITSRLITRHLDQAVLSCSSLVNHRTKYSALRCV